MTMTLDLVYPIVDVISCLHSSYCIAASVNKNTLWNEHLSDIVTLYITVSNVLHCM